MAQDAVSLVSEPLGLALQVNRKTFNAAFDRARRESPGLDAAVFSDFLRQRVDPLVMLVAETRPDCVSTVVSVLYDAALQLVAQNRAGARAVSPGINVIWDEMLAEVPHWLSEHPGQLIASLCNAVVHLSNADGGKATEWIRTMQSLAPLADSLDEWLLAGQVVAWLCGLAHYRVGALKTAAELRPALAQQIFKVSAVDRLSTLLKQLNESPWCTLDGGLATSRLVGSFVGFGGQFQEPPLVSSIGNEIYVRSGKDDWLLTADAFGATFHRTPRDQLAKLSFQHHIDIAANLPPELGQPTSSAPTVHTFALTSELSHGVYLIPREPS